MSLIKMWGFWKCLELTRGTHHVATPHGGAGHPGPRLGMVWAPLALHLTILLPGHSLSPTIHPPLLKHEFLLRFFEFFGSPCSAHHLC